MHSFEAGKDGYEEEVKEDPAGDEEPEPKKMRSCAYFRLSDYLGEPLVVDSLSKGNVGRFFNVSLLFPLTVVRPIVIFLLSSDCVRILNPVYFLNCPVSFCMELNYPNGCAIVRTIPQFSVVSSVLLVKFFTRTCVLAVDSKGRTLVFPERGNQDIAMDCAKITDYKCDNRRFWLSAHDCQVPTPTSQNLEVDQKIRIFGAD
jgi:hypothetical protein